MFLLPDELDSRLPFGREWRRQLELKHLFPPKVRLGGRLTAYVADEIFSWERARIAGATDDQVKALVQRLVAARATAAAELLGSEAQKCATVETT